MKRFRVIEARSYLLKNGEILIDEELRRRFYTLRRSWNGLNSLNS